MLQSALVVDNDSVHTDTACFQSHSPDHLFSDIHGCARSAMAQDNDSRLVVTHSHNISSWQVTDGARGAQEVSLLDSSFLLWWPAAGALSCEDVWWTGKFAGPLLFLVRGRSCVRRNAGGARVELILRRSGVDDHGASGHPTSTRVIQSSITSSSQGYSEPHWCERSGTSEGLHWP